MCTPKCLNFNILFSERTISPTCCYSTRLVDKAGLTHEAFDKMSIHEKGREVAEITCHDFRPRNDKKDELTSMKKFEEKNQTAMRRRTGWSNKGKYEAAMAIDER